MDIFISYRDSADAAEKEFLKLFRELGSSGKDQLSLAGTHADGWSHMLPGLVCDLFPEIPAQKSPAMFIGFLDDQSLISCELQDSSTLARKPQIMQILREQDRKYNIDSLSELGDSNRLNFLSKIVDGTVSIRPIPHSVTPPYLGVRGEAETVSGFTDSDSPISSIMEMAATRGERRSFDARMADLLILLFNTSEARSNTATLRKLTRDYNCRVAWSSIQLDEFTLGRSSPLDPAIDFFAVPVPESQGNGNMRMLKSFWERHTSFMKPLGLSQLRYSSLVEQKRPLSFPSWLQFLVFVSKAGRRANAKLRTYSIPKFLKLRRRGNRTTGARGRRRGPTPPGDPFLLKTVAQLFRGSDAPLPVGPELRERTMRLVRQKRRLLQVERSLYVPNADTIYSLYRGDVCPVRAPTRRSRDSK
jgi:hypothetical protein